MSTKKKTGSSSRHAPRAESRVLRELLEDQRDVFRLATALGRHRQRTGSSDPYARLTRDVDRLAQELDDWIEDSRASVLSGRGGRQVSAEIVRGIDRQRARLHQLLAELPLRLFTGLGVYEKLIVPSEDPALTRKRVPAPADQLEDALLCLPMPWLRSVRVRHGVRGHRARIRIAAAIAEVVHRPRTLAALLRNFLGPEHLGLLARLVAAGKTPVAALSPAEQSRLAVPKLWSRGAPGAGGALRQAGLAFLGREDGHATVYVPEGARSPIALVLARCDEEGGASFDPDLLRKLDDLAEPERSRRAREAAGCQGLCASPWETEWRLPTRLARLRRPTPGPDRVAEIEVRSERPEGRMTRRILISYQRTLGALREVIQLAFVHLGERGRLFVPPDTGQPLCLWLDPSSGEFQAGARDEWATSIRDALTRHGTALHYHHPQGTPVRYTLRLVRLHAPERVAHEPHVLWGDGVDPGFPDRHEPAWLRASLDAANLFLQRL